MEKNQIILIGLSLWIVIGFISGLIYEKYNPLYYPVFNFLLRLIRSLLGPLIVIKHFLEKKMRSS